MPVDPYLKPGDPGSGLLPFIQPGDGGTPGEGDACVQAYNFRLCYTQDPANRLPHRQPAKYDPAKYELLARYLEALVAAGHKPELRAFWNPIWMPNHKTDINNNGGFSTDFIGANYAYPDADYATRAQIWQAHEDYIRGFVYFLATSPRVPENMRAEMRKWGPARDEFLDTGNWPHQLYVREARRMVSDYVMTEHHCRGQQKAEDPVGLGAYGMDSHNCQRIVKGRPRGERGGRAGRGVPALPDLVSLDCAEGRRVREPAGADLPVRDAHRLRVHSHGAGVHDPGAIGGHRRRAGDGRQVIRAEAAL